MKLQQKQFLKGSREFEIDGDTLFVRIKSFLKEEKLTVDLSYLEPEPVINGSEMVFYHRYKGRPVFALLLDKPNSDEFNTFINALKQAISGIDNDEEDTDAEPSESVRAEALARNVYEEPPEFAENVDKLKKTPYQPVNVERLTIDISMLKTYLNENDIGNLLITLERLRAEPDNEAAFEDMMDAFNNLGITQGAVLTYATYLKILASQYMN